MKRRTASARILDPSPTLEPKEQRLVRHWRALPENERCAVLWKVEVASLCMHMDPIDKELAPTRVVRRGRKRAVRRAKPKGTP